MELTVLRRKYRDDKLRADISFLYASHRSLYMGERMHYADRILEATDLLNIFRFLSLVMDGMQQNNSIIPWFGNTYNCVHQVKQHLQGVTTHGKRSVMFRTFGNSTAGANLAIHTMLLALWEEYQLNGRLQEVLYVEVDGGSENANQEMKIICNMLIMFNIGIRTINLIRMPTGHNHADQDSKFGTVWLACRFKFYLFVCIQLTIMQS